MARRIDVELTSEREDGTWTWRAAGARQPKGVLDGALLYDGAKVGDVLRADADFEVDGIFITSVLPPKADSRREPERLELLGPSRPQEGVTTSLVGRDRGDRDRGDRGDRDRGERGPRGDRGDRARPGRTGDRPGRAASPERARRDRTGRPEREERRPDAPTPAKGRERDERKRPTGHGPGRSEGRPSGTAAPETAPSAPRSGVEAGAGDDERPKPRRLAPGHVHRSAVLETLPPEQRPIAEQLLRGGMPAVRQAVEAQNQAAREDGSPAIPAGQVLALAEQLLPRLKTAEWRDRAEAAAKMADEISLRDLRSVVAGADAAARDDETRLLASTLRDALESRLRQQRDAWLAEIGAALDEGRLVRALRLSARPPDPGARFPAEVAARLSAAAGEAMAADTPPDRWTAVLDAVGASPVRRLVKPAGLPDTPGEDLLRAARQACGRVPAVAALLGIDMPPPPGPPRPPRPAPARGGIRPGQLKPWSARGMPSSPGRTGRARPAVDKPAKPAQPPAPSEAGAPPQPSETSEAALPSEPSQPSAPPQPSETSAVSHEPAPPVGEETEPPVGAQPPAAEHQQQEQEQKEGEGEGASHPPTAPVDESSSNGS